MQRLFKEFKPITEEYIKQSHCLSYKSLKHSYPIHGKGFRFIQDLRTLSNTVIPPYPLCLILPPCSKPYHQKVNYLRFYISVMPFSVFLSILEASSYLLPFGRTTVHLDSNVSGLHWGSHLLFSNLKGRYHQKRVPISVLPSTICTWLLLCSTSEEASFKNSLHLLQELAKGGHKLSKEKLQVCKSQIKYMGHLITNHSLLCIPTEFKLSWPFQRQLSGFLGLAGYCRDYILNFSTMTQSRYSLHKLTKQRPLHR